MPVVILSGGMGTRLREETERLPKPLLEIGEKPILWHIMKIYGQHNFRRFVLCLGYKSWLIKEFFLRYREHVSDFTLEMNEHHEPTFRDGLGNEDWEVTCAETGRAVADSRTRKNATPILRRIVASGVVRDVPLTTPTAGKPDIVRGKRCAKERKAVS